MVDIMKQMNIKKKKVKKIITLCLVSIICLSGIVYGWFYFMDDHNAKRDDIDVMAPYFLYLLNPGDTNSLQFAVGNLHPGETKQTIICVSNKKPDDVTGEYFDIAKDSDFNYELELVQTNNLDVNYTLYHLERYEYTEGYVLKADEFMVDEVPGYYFKKIGNKLTGTDTTAERRNAVFGDSSASDIVNNGTYTLYSRYSDNSKMHLQYIADNNQYDYNYYMIEMNWNENAQFIENSKETDLLYVVVNAMQLKPEEQ